MGLFKGFLEIVGKTLGIVVGHFKQHGGLFGAKLFGGKVNGHRSLEGIEEGAAEHPGAVLGGVGVGGPGGNHGNLFVIGHSASGHGLTGRLRANNGHDLVTLNKLQGDVNGRFGFGFIVFINEFKWVHLVAHFQPALGVDLFLQHFSRVLGTFTHLGNFTGKGDGEPDFDWSFCGHGRLPHKERQGTD